MSREDIWQTARALLEEFGEQAPLEASKRISELANKNDEAGAAEWGDILAAMVVLRMRDRPSDTLLR